MCVCVFVYVCVCVFVCACVFVLCVFVEVVLEPVVEIWFPVVCV